MQSKQGNGQRKKEEKKVRPGPKYSKSIPLAQQSATPVQLSPPGPLLEAYKKHVEELRGIEDRQSKLIALLLGILSAAGTLLIEKAGNFGCASKLFVSGVAILIVLIGHHAIHEFHDLRVAVRDLLVRCEMALRFHEVGAFLEGEPLYTDYELGYPTRGSWMKKSYIWIVWIVCVGFLVLLWQKETSAAMHALKSCFTQL